jgi:putative ubiquitin-RnfH superfamily antitoxin RatB of RatAB toxin-antitoxin module
MQYAVLAKYSEISREQSKFGVERKLVRLDTVALREGERVEVCRP